MSVVLKKAFYDRATVDVARGLLGQSLCRRLESGRVLRSRIIETEAYDGFEDRASHAHKRMTPRNEVMFGPPGRTYLYLCYGVHWLLNVTTRESGYPAAVLIRGVEAVSGPGRLTRHFELNRAHNRKPLRRVEGLWIEAEDSISESLKIVATPRIGVDYAGEKWASMPWRFVLEGLHL